MAYEVEAVADMTSAAPTQSQPQMREERVITPYRVNKPTLEANSGQIHNSSESSVAPKNLSEETVTLSGPAAALARKEQGFRKQQQEFKAKELAMEAERAEIAELKALKAKLASKDYSDFENLVPYDEYSNFLLNKAASSSPEQQALKKLETEIENIKKSNQEDVSKRFEEAVNQRRKAVTELINSNDEYSSVKELNMAEAVVQHILDTWEQDSVELTPEQASKEVEEILVERAQKWTSLTKIKGKSPSVEETKQLPPLKSSIKTLTNNMAATGEFKRPLKSLHGLSDTERYAEARRRVEEKLKQK